MISITCQLLFAVIALLDSAVLSMRAAVNQLLVIFCVCPHVTF